MKLPWRDKTGIPKAIAILATIFMVSIGLCGANFFAFLRFGTLEDSTSVSTLLWISGWIELAVIIGSILAIAVLLPFEGRARKPRSHRNSSRKGSE